MEPMLIGAALGGGTSALMGKNPIQGALLGGLSGGVYGAASSAAGSTVAPVMSTGMGAAGSAVPGVMGAAPTMLPSASTTAFGSSLPSVMAPSASGFALNPALPSMIPNVTTQTLNTGLMAAPFNAASTAAPSFMQTLRNIPSALNQGARENPMYTLQGLSAAKELATPEPMPQIPMGQVQRGQPVAPVDFASLLNPQQYKPQPISLLG